MGARAKVILNEYSAKNLLMRDTLDLDKFYTADLKLFVEVARKEIERLNNIINELSKENQELIEKTKLFHKNRVFSLEYDKETLRDMVLEYQEKIDKALEKINDYKIYCKENKGLSEYTDIEIEAIEPVISKLEDILKGSDKE